MRRRRQTFGVTSLLIAVIVAAVAPCARPSTALAGVMPSAHDCCAPGPSTPRQRPVPPAKSAFCCHANLTGELRATTGPVAPAAPVAVTAMLPAVVAAASGSAVRAMAPRARPSPSGTVPLFLLTRALLV